MKTPRIKQKNTLCGLIQKQTKLVKLYRTAGQTRWIYCRLISSRNLRTGRASFANRKGTINCARNDTAG